jgi:hypothetical protein
MLMFVATGGDEVMNPTPDDDTPLPLSIALRRHPVTRYIHASSGRRWVKKGVKTEHGVVRLAGRVVGRRIYVSLAAITEFINTTSAVLGETTAV